MKIIFWQNILSIHQEALLVELAKKVEVWLIYEEELNESRKAMGWGVPIFEGVKLVSVEDIDSDINNLLQNIDHDYHIFSGINSYPKISKYFNIFYKKDPSKIICFLEKPGGISTGLKSHLRLLKYKFYASKYKKIKYLLTPGGEKYFLNAGFKRDSIKKFAYFGPEVVDYSTELIKNNIIEFVYVGNLSKLKNVKLVIQALVTCEYSKWHMNIIGDGEERESLVQLVNDLELTDQITFLGMKSNCVVQEMLLESDFLILPSLYDGWGYVVNEALSKGCSVICSDACGVSSVVKDCKGSYVFSSNSIEHLENILYQVLSREPLNMINKREKINFFQNNISGRAGAEQLLEMLQ